MDGAVWQRKQLLGMCTAADAEPGSLSCSRNSENMTRKYPDLAARVPQLLKECVQDVVLDCECVAYDRETKKIMPFQV